MINKTLKAFLLLGTCGLFAISSTTFAEVFFEEDFEAKGDDPGGVPAGFTPNPIWSLAAIIDIQVGPGDMFENTTAACHTGTTSLRFNYEGRNGFCNTCGIYNAKHLGTGHDGVDYFITDEDLTAIENPLTSFKANDGPLAEVGKVIYNNDNGFSKWEITEVVSDGGTNNRLNLKLLKAGINGEKPEFNSRDTIGIARLCGVDGHIGGVISRRNDCDGSIIYFNHVEAGHQQPGESIFRRVYLKSEVSSKAIHQKLHYWNTNNKVPNGQDPSLPPLFSTQVILLADSNNNRPLEPQLVGLQVVGGLVYTTTSKDEAKLPPIEFERGKWYYIEEEYKAATNDGPVDEIGIQNYNSDGEYRLWLASSASNPQITDAPIIEATGLSMGPINQESTGISNSFWGNVQHEEHTVGSWYMDDMVVQRSTRIGPIPQSASCPDIATPAFPATSN